MHPTAGCLPCKLRKKKCDGTKPRCKGCQRNVLICAWPNASQQRRGSKGVPSSAMSMFSIKTENLPQEAGYSKAREESCVGLQVSRRPLPSPSPSSVPRSLSPNVALKGESQYLLNHYLHQTGKMASGHVGDYTPFVDALLPIANKSDVLLESILTFSSFHLSSRACQVQPVHAAEHHARALRNLKLGLTRYASGDREVGVQLFLAMLMLCCVELASDYDDESSFQHMAGLRHVAPDILSRWDTIPEAYKPAMTFGRELYAYFLAVSCICAKDTARDRTNIQDSGIVFSDIERHGYTGAMFGCSDGLFRLVAEVVANLKEARKLDLRHRVPTTSAKQAQPHLNETGSLDEVATLMTQISLLLPTVALWEPPGSCEETFQVSGRIFQLALTVLLVEASHLCTVVKGSLGNAQQSTPNLESKTTPLVTEFVALLEKLPVQSWIVTTMCWPITVLGSYATTQQHRATVRQYMLDMEATFGFRNMTRARLLLEYMWSKICTFETDRPIDISEAMMDIGGRFMLG